MCAEHPVPLRMGTVSAAHMVDMTKLKTRAALAAPLMQPMDRYYVLVPATASAPVGERITFYRAQPVHHWADEFTLAELAGEPRIKDNGLATSAAFSRLPERHVVLQVTDLTFDTKDPGFDPRRNYQTGFTAGTVLREVPVSEQGAG